MGNTSFKQHKTKHEIQLKLFSVLNHVVVYIILASRNLFKQLIMRRDVVFFVFLRRVFSPLLGNFPKTSLNFFNLERIIFFSIFFSLSFFEILIPPLPNTIFFLFIVSEYLSRSKARELNYTKQFKRFFFRDNIIFWFFCFVFFFLSSCEMRIWLKSNQKILFLFPPFVWIKWIKGIILK